MSARSIATLALVVFASLASAGCVGAGEGSLSGTVNLPVCDLSGAFDLHASFFGGYRNGRMLFVQIQNGGAIRDYQDHMILVFDNTDEIAARIATSPERDEQGRPVVTLPVGNDYDQNVLVHATFFPQWTCGRVRSTRLGNNVGLRAVAGSTITIRSIDRGTGANGVGTSSDPQITDVPAMHLELRDDRPIGFPAPAGFSPDSPIGSATLNGFFKFSYRRGPSAQPFS